MVEKSTNQVEISLKGEARLSKYTKFVSKLTKSLLSGILVLHIWKEFRTFAK